MSRRPLILPAVIVALLGALALLCGEPGNGTRPPDPPVGGSGDGVPGSDAGAGEAGAPESPGAPRMVRGRVIGVEAEDRFDAESGEPVVGARVLAFELPESGTLDPWLPWGDSPEAVPAAAAGVSGDAGRFELRLPSTVSGDLLLIARAEGYCEGAARGGEPGAATTIVLDKSVPATWRVEDLEERPVAGAEVLVYGESADGLPRARLVTDDRGGFRESFGTQDSILVRMAGYATARLDELPFHDPRVVVLHPSFPLAGTVTDTDGRPVEGAAVRLWHHCWRALRVTRADGRFGFSGLAGDASPRLEVTAPGFMDEELSPLPGREDVVVVVRRRGESPPTGRVPVRVVLPVGVRAERTRFEVRRLPDRESADYGVDESRMESDGLFELTGLQPGEYEILSEYGHPLTIPYQVLAKTVPRYRATARVRIEAGKQAPPVTLTLVDIGASFVCIRVLDGAGRPAEQVRLHCETPGLGTFTKDHHWYTSASGRVVTAVEAPPGTRVTYTAYPEPRHEGIPTTVEVTTLATAEGPFTDLPLQPGARVSIRVVGPEGNPLPRETDLVVNVMQGGWPEWRGLIQPYHGPAPSRPVEVSLLPDHAFTLNVNALGLATRIDTFPAPGDDGAQVEVRLLPWAGLSGRLLTPGGAPAGVASIQVLDASGGDVTSLAASFPGGGFVLDGLPAGQLTFLAEVRDRGLVVVRELDLSSGGERDLGAVTMRLSDRIRGVVFGIDGRPAGGVELTLRPARESRSVWRTVTRTDGSFELIRRACREPVLVARAPDDSALAIVPVPEGMTPETLTVRLAAAAEIHARFESPAEVRRIEPRLHVETGSGALCFSRVRANWTEDHRLSGYRLTRVPAGAIVLRFTGRLVDGRPLSAKADVTAKPGGESEVVLRPLR